MILPFQWFTFFGSLSLDNDPIRLCSALWSPKLASIAS